MSKPDRVSVIPAEEPRAVSVMTPMDMIQRAVESGADIDMLEKLMALQERWEASQARKAFDEAVANAKAEIPVIIKNAKGHNSKYADFAAIARAVDPVISKHGIRYRFRTNQTDKLISVTCVLTHKDGHAEENTLVGPIDATTGKNAIQAIGSTLTYLQRYSLVQALGLAATDDDDGKSASSAPTITQDQADNLRELLEANGKDRAKFLRWARVEKIEDIRADYYQSCLDAVNAKGAK